MSASALPPQFQEKIAQEFKSRKQILTFDEYLNLTKAAPQTFTRGTAEYTADMMDHYGREGDFFKVFLEEIAGFGTRVLGQEKVQNRLYQSLRAFSRLGVNNRLILLHGPNGSAKSTLLQSLMQGLERYSKTIEGALYTFSWIFPVDRITRGGLGIRGDQDQKTKGIVSFAHLAEEDIACIIPSELKDNPLLLLPYEQRMEWLSDHAKSAPLPMRIKSGLSHRDHLIFQALLTNYQGDLSQVLRHVRVERFFLSRLYRSGLVTLEPQMHVDAQFQQLTMNRSLSSIPVYLQGINLFSITGDLPDANRGVIDYADLLKRPLDSFKYLLSACETGRVTVGHSNLELDTVFIGSSNELQLDAFKEYPDFSSFKGRLELIRVPYLLKQSQETQVYEALLPQMASTKPITPHTAWAASFWAVLTRLKKPLRENYPSEVGVLVDKLSPIEKLKLYDTQEVPERFNNEERKLLKANINVIAEEFANEPFYEGRTGASAREIKSLLMDSAQSPNFKTLSPLSFVAELRKFTRRTSEYDFLRVDTIDGYHHNDGFIEVLLNEYAARVDREVRECLGLYETKQWGEFMKKYISNVSSLLKKEKIKNPITGGYDEPDQTLIQEFETIADSPKDPIQLDQFRHNLITQIGAWVLDHPKEPMDYFRVFPEIRSRIEKHFYESQKALLQKMNTALKMFGTDHEDPTSEGTRLARQTIENMQKKFGYSLDGAKEVIGFLMTKKY